MAEMAMLENGGMAKRKPRLCKRLAAGGFHNLTLSNAINKKEKLGDGETNPNDHDPQRNGRVTDVFAFGSNRNNVFEAGIRMLELSTEEDGAGAGGSEDEQEPPTVREDPVQLDFFQEKIIYEVASGGAHSVFLEKVPGREGAVVWVCGLGSNGRLGIERPKDKAAAEELLRDALSDLKESEDEYVRKRLTLDHLMKNEDLWNLYKTKWVSPCPLRVKLPEKEEIVSVACGVDHTLVLTERGLVYAWGLGSFGNLGLGHTNDAHTPTEITALSDKPCDGISAGTKHSIAVTRKGHMYSWGYGGNGRLGQGESRSAALLPGLVNVHPATPMEYVAAGEAHTCSIDNVGNVYSWGAGSYGRLGHGEETDVPAPTRIQALSGIPMRQVELGTLHSVALTIKGHLWTWGSGEATGLMEKGGKEAGFAATQVLNCRNHDGSDDTTTDKIFVQIATGAFHTLALERKGWVYSWGLGSEGRLGLGDQETNYLPTMVKIGPPENNCRMRGWVDFDELEGSAGAQEKKHENEEEEAKQKELRSIHCGGMHSSAVVGKGEFSSFWVWGSNEYGQIGMGDENDHNAPEQPDIKYLKSSVRIECVALGLEHCIVSTDQKVVFVWGRNSMGQLGLGNPDDKVKTPQLLQGLVGVVQVAAGEDHSAAIVETGELYTWGSADCGKLGYGSGMTSGTQNYPRVIRTEEQFSQVSCGMQHTVVKDKHGKLFTFGAGWYGRLGHGTMDNQYHPKEVKVFDAWRKVEDAQCGCYFTVALVGVDRRVWVTGRDRGVCEDDHVQTFQPLKGFDKSCTKLAVGAMHTLVLTDKGEVYAWGDNSKGQLGCPCDTGRLSVPAKVFDPNPKGGAKNHAWTFDLEDEHREGLVITHLVTGYAHTLVGVRFSDSDDPKIYAFGNRTGGRLGLEERPEKGKDEGEKRPEPKSYDSPQKVDMKWRSADDEDEGKKRKKGGGEGSGEGGDPAQGGQPESKKVKTLIFGVLQSKLKNEEPECLEPSLKAQEKKLEDIYHDFIDDIWHLWNPPEAAGDGESESSDSGAKTEWHLRRLQSRLEKSLCKNLITMGLADTYPQIDGSLTHPDISARLVHYEELLWVLQQHPCYLGNLSKQLKFGEPTYVKFGVHRATIPQNLLMDVIGNIFKRLRDSRTKRLFMTLICVMIKNEVEEMKEHEKKMSGTQAALQKETFLLFDKGRSKVAACVRMLVEHQALKEFHEALYRIDASEGQDGAARPGGSKDKDTKKESLVSIIFDWSVDKASNQSKAEHKEGKEGGNSIAQDALFVFSDEDMMKIKKVVPQDDKQREQFENNTQEELHKNQNTFQRFMGVEDELHKDVGPATKNPAKGSKKTVTPQVPEIKKPTFIDYIKALEIPADIKAIFAMVKDIVEDAIETEQSIMKQFEQESQETNKDKEKKSQAEDFELSEGEKKLYSPMMMLFMSSILGHLLEHYDKVMPKKYREAMKTKLKRRLNERSGSLDESVDKVLAQWEERVDFNIKQLGRFLQKAAVKDFRSEQKKLADCAQIVQEKHVIKDLFRKLEDATDNTEVELTQDLYKSHYEMNKISLVLETKSLLHLSNALWLHINHIVDLPPEMLKQDILYNTLLQTLPTPDEDMPKEKLDELKKDPEYPKKSRLWPEWMLLIAEKTSVQHNFTVQHRFLEFHKDLCFCRICRAPILRSMAPKEQRGRTDLRLIRTYRPDLGMKLENTYPQKTLADVLAIKEVPAIKSRDWISLKSEFEEMQKTFRDKISRTANKAQAQKDFQLVEALEKGKQACDQLRVGGQQPDGMVKYVLACLETRREQRHYLKELTDGKAEIQEAQDKYKEKLVKMIPSLKKVVEASEEASVPQMFRNKAQEKGKILKLQEVEKINRQRAAADTQSHVPSKEYSLGTLRSKKVVAWVSADLPRSQYKRIFFTFNGRETGDWQVIVTHRQNYKTHALFQFEISRSDVERMQHAGKTARMPYNEGWVVINAFALLQLLARCTAEGG